MRMIAQLAAATIALVVPQLATAHEASVVICAMNESGSGEFDIEFERGPLVIPAQSVFDYAGHLMANDPQDPLDRAHGDIGKWAGVTAQESERRSQLLLDDDRIDQKNTEAFITTSTVVLTPKLPCALTGAKAVLSSAWGWVESSISPDPSKYYQLYGIVTLGHIKTNIGDNSPLDLAMVKGEINASVRSKIVDTFRLNDDE